MKTNVITKSHQIYALAVKYLYNYNNRILS